jgi:hypothetical protein
MCCFVFSGMSSAGGGAVASVTSVWIVLAVFTSHSLCGCKCFVYEYFFHLFAQPAPAASSSVCWNMDIVSRLQMGSKFTKRYYK